MPYPEFCLVNKREGIGMGEDRYMAVLPVGTRVVCNVDEPDGIDALHEGSLGTIVGSWNAEHDGNQIVYQIRWDDDIEGHNCSGLCESGHGWNMFPHEITPIYDGSSCEEELTEVSPDDLAGILY